MNEKQVDIAFMSFYFTDVIFMVVDRLHEVTKHPFRIIVGDNLSENSPVIREKLRSYVEQGKISTAYFFDNNSRYNRMEMYKNEPKPDYYIGSDQDALIEDNQDGCWLTDYVEMLESDNNVGIAGFSAKNGWGSRSGQKRTSQRTTVQKWKMYPPKRRGGHGLPFNGHLIAIKSEFMDGYRKTGMMWSDGSIQRFLAELGYASARYDKSSVYNVSSIKRGFKVDGMDIAVDHGYKKLRVNFRHVRRKSGNFEIIRSDG
jgi:hypothetical protein